MKSIFKKTRTLAALGTAALWAASCTSELDQFTQTVITDPVFWKTESDLIAGTNYLYTSMPDFSTPAEDLMSDFAVDIRTNTVNSVSDGSRNAPSNDGRWNNAYAYVRAANNVIEKSAGVPNSAMKTYCIAQARFFRAMAYYDLVKTYGDVPYLNRTVSGREDPLLYTPRTDRRVVIDSVYADLDFAAANCPQADQLPLRATAAGTSGREYGRITRSAALAFKSRVALFEGSWHKFHGEPQLKGPKDPAKHFNIAKAAAQTVMQEGKHSLFTGTGALSYQDQFRYPGEYYGNNKENIMVRLYGQNLSNNVSSQSYMRPMLTDGGNAATRAYVLTALYADGLPAGKSPLDKNGQETGLLTDTENRDPRVVQTLFKVGDAYASIAGGNPLYPNTFHYHQQKYWTGQADFMQQTLFLDFIAIRYGEVLLNYAEATYELGEAISDADLDATVNLLRKRATNNENTKLPLLTNAFVSANGLNMRQEIRRERSVELAFEGFRYWDIIRWKIAEEVLPKAILMRKFYPGVNYGGAVTPPLLNGYVQFQAADRRRFNPQRDYLWPIPTAQIGLSNQTITQNPNW